MGFGFKHGSGGAEPLAFRVIASLTEPETFRENDIWVKAEGMTGWAIAPRLPEAEEGTVCIVTGENAPVCFNALKKDALNVCPVSAWQFSGGEWRRLDAWAFVGGGSVQFSLSWDGYYFKDGDQYEAVTGGWSSDGWSSDPRSTVAVGDILSVLTPAAAYVARVGTNDPVDLTDADTIWFDSPNGKNGHGYSGALYICTEKDENSKVASAAIGQPGIGSIDVSGLSGPHYLLLRALGGSQNGDKKGYADVRAIWKE